MNVFIFTDFLVHTQNIGILIKVNFLFFFLLLMDPVILLYNVKNSVTLVNYKIDKTISYKSQPVFLIFIEVFCHQTKNLFFPQLKNWVNFRSYFVQYLCA